MAPDSDLFKLWQFGTKRCLMTPRDGNRPFTVSLYDGDSLTYQRAFQHHDAAVAFAVEALRIAAEPSGSEPAIS
jgi:hypothetical protein